jgi:hypothetical protein
VGEIIKPIQTILPPGAKGCGSISDAMKVLMSSFAIEHGEDNVYVQMCKELGLEPETTTLATMHAHTVNINALKGDMTAEKILHERTEGKITEKLIEEDPIRNLTDKQLDDLEAEQLLLENKDNDE